MNIEALDAELRDVMAESETALRMAFGSARLAATTKQETARIEAAVKMQAHMSGAIDGKNTETREAQMFACMEGNETLMAARKALAVAEEADQVDRNEVEVLRMKRGIYHDLVTLYAAAMSANGREVQP